MRNAAAGALFASLLLSPSAFAASVVNIDNVVVMPVTPSGEGDPNTMVCRAPQPIAGTDQLGPKRCGYNFEWWKLTSQGKDLAPDGMTVFDRPMVSNPTGKGNPDAVTCRKPKHLPGPGRNFGPEVCLSNQLWADLIRNRKMITADGVVVAEPGWMPTFGYSNNPDPLAGYRVGGN